MSSLPKRSWIEPAIPSNQKEPSLPWVEPMSPESLDFRPNPFWLESTYGEALLRLSKALHEMWLPDYSVRDRNYPGIIYHYTTADGLIGILESNEFWATALNYMNDASELTYAQRLIKDVIDSRQVAIVDPALRSLYERAARMVEPGYRVYYGVCFCHEGDLLSQWRAYGARGGGFAIGLQADEIGLRSKVPLCIRKVIYNPDDQRRLVETLLARTGELLLELVQDEKLGPGGQALPVVVHFLEDHLAEYTFTFKNPAFQEEKEWRVVLPILPYEMDDVGRQTRFRNSGGMLVPFIPLNVGPSVGPNAGRLPLARIVFGPTVDPDLTGKAVTGLLRKHNFSLDVETVSSAIPLRG